VVLTPSTAEEIGAILRICNAHVIPVTPRGGGTSLSGGSLPVEGGVVVWMKRFNRILNIDELNLQATVEPGVITEVFQNAVKEVGLFYPPDPSSRGTCVPGWKLGRKCRWTKSGEVWRNPRLCAQYASGAAHRRGDLDGSQRAQKFNRLQPYTADVRQRRHAGHHYPHCFQTTAIAAQGCYAARSFTTAKRPVAP
jgi:hypothetical protein